MKYPRPAPAPPGTQRRDSTGRGVRGRTVDGDDEAREDDDESARPLSTHLRQIEVKTCRALARHQKKKEAQVKDANQVLDELASASVRTVVLHALRHGVSKRPLSGEPAQTAVSDGAMLVARVLHREGVAAAELKSLLALWKTPIDAPELFVAAEQLLGQGFCRLPYEGGAPLSDLCEILFGSAHEVGDLIAAGAIVGSISRKLAMLENEGPPMPATKPRKPFVRKYTVPGGSTNSPGAPPRPN